MLDEIVRENIYIPVILKIWILVINNTANNKYIYKGGLIGGGNPVIPRSNK